MVQNSDQSTNKRQACGLRGQLRLEGTSHKHLVHLLAQSVS